MYKYILKKKGVFFHIIAIHTTQLSHVSLVSSSVIGVVDAVKTRRLKRAKILCKMGS